MSCSGIAPDRARTLKGVYNMNHKSMKKPIAATNAWASGNHFGSGFFLLSLMYSAMPAPPAITRTIMLAIGECVLMKINMINSIKAIIAITP